MMKRENHRKSGQSGSAKRLACSLWEMGSHLDGLLPKPVLKQIFRKF